MQGTQEVLGVDFSGDRFQGQCEISVRLSITADMNSATSEIVMC